MTSETVAKKPKKVTKKQMEINRRTFYKQLVIRVKEKIVEKNPDYLFVIKHKNLQNRVSVSSLKSKDLQKGIKDADEGFYVLMNKHNKRFIEKGFLKLLLIVEEVIIAQGRDFAEEVVISDDDIMLGEMISI
jgi:hypothetical protein